MASFAYILLAKPVYKAEATLEIGKELSSHDRAAVAGMKKMIREVRSVRRSNALQVEADVFAGLWGGQGHRKAMDGFFRTRREGKKHGSIG